MKLKGLCTYCGMESISTCSSCGAQVCSKHLIKYKDICSKCVRGKV